jgi:hypothetical protein
MVQAIIGEYAFDNAAHFHGREIQSRGEAFPAEPLIAEWHR